MDVVLVHQMSMQVRKTNGVFHISPRALEAPGTRAPVSTSISSTSQHYSWLGLHKTTEQASADGSFIEVKAYTGAKTRRACVAATLLPRQYGPQCDCEDDFQVQVRAAKCNALPLESLSLAKSLQRQRPDFSRKCVTPCRCSQCRFCMWADAFFLQSDIQLSSAAALPQGYSSPFGTPDLPSVQRPE